MNELSPQMNRFRTDWMPPLLTGLVMFVVSTTSFYLPVFFKETLGFSGTQIGLLFALQAVTGLLAAFPTGLGNDRITSRTLAGAGIFVQAIGLALMALVKSFFPYLVVFFIWTLANNVFRLSMDLQVLKTDDGLRTGRRIAWYQTMRFGGAGLGIVVAGYLLNSLDFQKTFLAVAIALTVLLLIVRLLVPTPVTRANLAEYRADFFTPRVILFTGWLFLFSTHWGAEQTCYSLFLRSHFHLELHQMGWYMCAEFIALIAALLLAAPYVDKQFTIGKLALYGLLASGIGHVGMALTPLAFSVAFRMLHGVGDGFIFFVFFLGAFRLFNIQRMGGNAGLLQFSMMGGAILGALIYSPIGERFGYGLPFWISGGMLLLLTLPLLFRARRA